MAKNKTSVDVVVLIVMSKDGSRLAVHPSCVKAHERVGWIVEPEQPAPIEDVPDEPEDQAIPPE